MTDHTWKTMKQNAWYVDDFIERQIVPFYKDIYKKNEFLSFGIICSGIEFLGKCLDDQNDFDHSDSENYFKNALKELFPEYWDKSSKNGISLYKALRCGLIHSVRPGDRIWLRDKNSATHPHLSIQDNKLHIIIDNLVEDFEKAGMEVVKGIRERKKYSHAKFYTPFIEF